MSVPLGPDPCNVTCHACNRQVTTQIEFMATSKTHIIALLLCLFGCWPCAAGLYCTGCARAKNHHCPNCNAYLGTYSE